MNAAAFSPWIVAVAAAIAPLLVDASAKSVVLMSLTLLLASALGRFGSASRRHWVLVLGVASLLALPVLSLVLPKWRILPDVLDSEIAVRNVAPAVQLAPPDMSIHPQPAPIAEPHDMQRIAIDAPSPPIETVYEDQVTALNAAASAPQGTGIDVSTQPDAQVWPKNVLLVWIGGVLIFLARLAYARLYLQRLAARSTLISDGNVIGQLDRLSRMVGIRRPVRLWISDTRAMPMMWGVLHPSILLPLVCHLWTAERLRTVLLHELAHVKRNDALVQLVVQLACALYWFNPLVWLAAWRIRVERERACDDLVLQYGTKASEYAEHLLAVATGFERPRPAQAAALAMAQRLRIEGRLSAILDGALKRTGVSRHVALSSLVVAAAVLMPIAMMHAGSKHNQADPTSDTSKDAEQKQQRSESTEATADDVKKPSPVEISVAGRVVDESGQPVSGAEVVALVRKDRRKATSNVDGGFELSVPTTSIPGLMLVARHAQGAQQAFHRLSYEQENAPKAPVPLVLRAARKIEATVVDTDNKPIAGVWTVVLSGYEKIDEAHTDANGKAVLTVPANAPLMYVAAIKPGVGLDYFAFRQPDRPRSDPYQLVHDHRGPLRFVLNGTKAVTVRVVDGKGQPVRGADVYSWYFEKPNKGADFNHGLDELSATTDERGIATLTSIPEDNNKKVTVWVRADGYFAPERTVWDPELGVNELTASLLPLVKVRGSAKLPDGRPAADIQIAITGGGHHEDTFYGSAKTDLLGRFEALVHPDEYYMFVPIDNRWAAPAQNLIVRQDDRDGIDFVLQPAARVYGRVTIGPEHAPWSKGHLQLYQKGGDYYSLPKEEQLPNPTGSSRAVYAIRARNTKSDADGRFEFFAGPGSYYITGPDNIKAPQFDIADQHEHEINIHLPGPDRGQITGRVVFSGDASRGVPEARLTGRSTSSRSSFLDAVTDQDGRFSAIGGLSGMRVHAVTKDGKQAGIVELPEGKTSFVMRVAPVGTARGRLLDEATGEPLPGRQIDYGVHVIYQDNPALSSSHFGGSTKSDERGEFELKDIVVDWEYTFSLVVKTDNKGQSMSWRQVGKLTAKDTGVTEVGDVYYRAPAPPLTVEARISKAFGNRESLANRLRDRQRDARLGHQRVMVIATNPTSDLCRAFYDLYHDDENPDVSREMANYLLLPLDITAKDDVAESQAFAKRLNFEWPAADDMTLAVISEDGKLVASLSCRAITNGDKLNRRRLNEFLAKHAPEMPDAEELLSVALAGAKRDDKRILVQDSGAYCAPCILLSRFLDDQRELIAKEYVYLPIDRRFKNGEAVIKRLGKEEGGIPWIVVLDSAGEPLINSNGPDGNIGFPSSPAGRAHFEKMLRETSRRLNESEIQMLLTSLAEEGK